MGKISEFTEKLKNFKHLPLIACLVLTAAVLTVYFCTASCSSDNASLFTSADSYDGTDYCSSMQKQVEGIISEISGVGKASVVINWDKSSVQSAFSSAQGDNPKALGALIVCDGGNSTKVKLDVIYAVSTLLDLSIEKIMVYPKSR